MHIYTGERNTDILEICNKIKKCIHEKQKVEIYTQYNTHTIYRVQIYTYIIEMYKA